MKERYETDMDNYNHEKQRYAELKANIDKVEANIQNMSRPQQAKWKTGWGPYWTLQDNDGKQTWKTITTKSKNTHS